MNEFNTASKAKLEKKTSDESWKLNIWRVRVRYAQSMAIGGKFLLAQMEDRRRRLAWHRTGSSRLRKIEARWQRSEAEISSVCAVCSPGVKCVFCNELWRSFWSAHAQQSPCLGVGRNLDYPGDQGSLTEIAQKSGVNMRWGVCAYEEELTSFTEYGRD